MAYLSYYRKYRPQTFAEILGQEHVSRTLANAIVEDRVAHAYLFTGPRGTGKTSTARILAKALNCAKGPTPDPCGECGACISIANGSSMDVIELDAASHSGVDDTREILAGVPLATAGGRKKVYVIDEVHMLSTPSFNALLKTLEEPPDHVVFILATTEAHKVLGTIQSRTQRFDFRPISADVLREHLTQVAKAEGIDIEDDALDIIARHAEGGARDALSALDQLSSLEGTITADQAERLFGGRGGALFVELFDAISSGDVGALFWALHSLVAKGADVRQLTRGSLEHARTLLLLKTAPAAEELLEAPEAERPALSAQAERFEVSALMRAVDLLAHALTEMREVPNHRLLLEVALVRIASPETDPSATGLLGRIERLERRIGVEGVAPAPEPGPAPPVASPPPEAPAAPTEAPPAAATPAHPEPRQRKKSGRMEPAGAKESLEPKEIDPEPTAPAAAAAPGEVGFGHVKDSWSATCREVWKRSKRVAAFLNPSRPVSFDGDRLIVEVQSEFHVTEMSSDRNRSMLIDALQAALGIKPAIEFAAQGAGTASAPRGSDAPQPASETPDRQGPPDGAGAAATDEDAEDYTTATEASSGEHDPVELLKKGFGAEVVEER